MSKSLRNLKNTAFKQREFQQGLNLSDIIPGHISIYLVWILIRTPITPNQITLFGLAIGIIAAGLFATGTREIMAIASGIYMLSIVLDYCDGKIARFKNISSLTGEYLDRINDAIVTPCVFGGITIGVFASNQSLLVIALGLSATASWLLIKLAVHDSHATVIEARMRHLKGHSEKTLVPDSIETDFDPAQATYTDMLEQRWWLLNIAGQVFSSPYLFLTAAGVLDLVLQFSIQIGPILIDSFMFIALGLYATALPTAAAITITTTIRNNLTEREYIHLFQEKP